MAMPHLDKVPKFLKRKGVWFLIAFIAFAYYASQKKFVTPVTPADKVAQAVQMDTVGIKPQTAPKEQSQSVIAWAQDAVKDIMEFNADNAPEHFRLAVGSYFSRQWKLQNNAKLAPDEVLQHVKDDCRAESIEIRDGTKVASYGTQGDSEMWTIHIPVTIVDAPYTGGSCLTMDDQKHPIDVMIAILVQKNAESGMKIAEWKMAPDGGQ